MLSALLLLFAINTSAASMSDCDPPTTEPPMPSFKTKLIEKIKKHMELVQPQLKNSEEIDRYMTCYQDERAEKDVFTKKYNVIVKRAAKAFQLPYAIIACIYAIESGWRPDLTTDKTGAFGLAQTMPTGGTIEMINDLISAKDQSVSYRKRYANLEAEVKAKRIKAGSDKYKSERAEIDVERKRNEVHTKVNSEWKRFWRNGLAPSKIKISELSDAEKSIAVGAMYYRYILLHVDEYSRKPMDNFLLAAGGYNKGPRTLVTRYKEAGYDLDTMLAKMQGETGDYIRRLKRCSEKNSWKPIGKGEREKKC